MLRVIRNIFVIFIVIVICSIFICSPAKGQNTDISENQYMSGQSEQINIALTVFCIIMALGVIFSGWQLIRLAGAITPIAKLLNDKTVCSMYCKPSSMFRVKNIKHVQNLISERLQVCNELEEKYDKKIEELKIQLQLSQKRESHIEEIIYSIRDSVIVIDEYEKLLMANESAGKLLNFDYKNSRYKPIRELISKERNEFLTFLSNTRKSKGQAARKEINIIDEGKSKTFDCIVSCVHDKNQQVCGVVGVLHDITREKEISNMKNDFISHVSHELKTPLASITAYSELLADNEADDEKTKQEFCTIIQSQAQRLNRLIEDILNTSRIESGLIKINKENESMTILIEEQLQMIKSYADEKNIQIIGQNPIVFDQVYIDRDMISQVIVNLLSNAVKYTPSGGSVKIETEIDESASVIRVSVIDTGVGIPENEIEHVFDKYYRVDANKKQAKGAGLGLNLVKQMVEKVHNGKVFVTSKVGHGSTFGFELPLASKKTVVNS